MVVLETRISQKDRTPLQDVIPLETPFVLFLDPSSSCNFRCNFCPTGNAKLLKDARRKNTLLDLGTFKKIIDDLQGFPNPIKVLRLYKDGEPFLNPNLAEMVAYARQSDRILSIDTTTNGSLLTPGKAIPVVEAGIDQINISLDGMSDEQFKDFTHTKVDFKKFRENLSVLYENRGDCKILIKTVKEILTPEQEKMFFDYFGPISDKIYVEHVAPCWPEFDVTEKVDASLEMGIYGQPISAVDTCPYVFYSLSINADGFASICFLDWKQEYIIGDANTESVESIWNSQKMNSYRVQFLKGERKDMPFCKDCMQLAYGMADNIDPYREELLLKVQQSLD
jgi:radical SAM protein with 4Fe4S-binding SPASM domain